ncbi:MAG: glycerol-3-phosphate 1-O-acyltransferase PlsY [Planctomycetota bacterium]|jgi:glycerol-3-phosphate acyltransferase PlsY
MDIGSPWADILAGLLAFSIGGIPFGWLAGRLLKGTDLRKVGSGSTGATNASRLWDGGWSIVAFCVIFVLDFAKGFCAAFFSHELGEWLMADSPRETVSFICGAAAILGHVFCPYLGFRGGKGVATAFGAVTALAPWSALVALAAWAIAVGVTRYMSLGSIAAMVALPISYIVRHGEDAWLENLGILLFLVGLAAIVIWSHRTNIARILAGTERKVGAPDQQL